MMPRIAAALRSKDPTLILRPLGAIAAHLGASFVLLVLVAVASSFGPFLYLALAILVALLVWTRNHFEAFICVFGLPLLAMVLAIGGYFRGSAKLQYMGLPHLEFFSIDPVYRCSNSTGGCLVSGNEWITEEPYNLTVETLISVFGPQRGSYTGPYPIESEAVAALSVAVPVDLSALVSDHFDVGQVHVHLDEGVGRKILRHYFDGTSVEDIKTLSDSPEDAHVSAAVWKSRVLLLRGPSYNAAIIVIDLNIGRPFAYYHGQRRFPPVMWRKADDWN